MPPSDVRPVTRSMNATCLLGCRARRLRGSRLRAGTPFWGHDEGRRLETPPTAAVACALVRARDQPPHRSPRSAARLDARRPDDGRDQLRARASTGLRPLKRSRRLVRSSAARAELMMRDGLLRPSGAPAGAHVRPRRRGARAPRRPPAAARAPSLRRWANSSGPPGRDHCRAHYRWIGRGSRRRPLRGRSRDDLGGPLRQALKVGSCTSYFPLGRVAAWPPPRPS